MLAKTQVFFFLGLSVPKSFITCNKPTNHYMYITHQYCGFRGYLQNHEI